MTYAKRHVISYALALTFAAVSLSGCQQTSRPSGRTTLELRQEMSELPQPAQVTPPTRQMIPLICGPRNELIDQLTNKYKEKPRAFGIALSGQLTEFLASDGGGTWTIILTSPEGITCLLAAGKDWRIAAPDGGI
tara:strand:- start:312 stop:716 length:405 start_codon:yes stop_codon:yes gene_type:complete